MMIGSDTDTLLSIAPDFYSIKSSGSDEPRQTKSKSFSASTPKHQTSLTSPQCQLTPFPSKQTPNKKTKRKYRRQLFAKNDDVYVNYTNTHHSKQTYNSHSKQIDALLESVRVVEMFHPKNDSRSSDEFGTSSLSDSIRSKIPNKLTGDNRNVFIFSPSNVIVQDGQKESNAAIKNEKINDDIDKLLEKFDFQIVDSKLEKKIDEKTSGLKCSDREFLEKYFESIKKPRNDPDRQKIYSQTSSSGSLAKIKQLDSTHSFDTASLKSQPEKIDVEHSKIDLDWSRANEKTLEQNLLLEKLKKESCKLKIEKLQTRLLESRLNETQEKMRHVLRANAEKDVELQRFRDERDMFERKFFDSTNERDVFEQKLQRLKAQMQFDAERSQNTLKTYKMELEKTSSAARTHQDRVSELESHIEMIKSKLEDALSDRQNLQDKMADLETRTVQLTNDNRQISDESQSIRDELDNERQKYSILLHEYTLASEKVEKLEYQQSKLTQEMHTLKVDSERARNEMRAFYQRNLDAIVREKLNEFQREMDDATETLKNQHARELEEKEKFLCAMAAKIQGLKSDVENLTCQNRYLESEHVKLTSKLNEETFRNRKVVEDFRALIARQQRELAQMLPDAKFNQMNEV